MTTKFGSFDASPLEGFVESPLGARNAPAIHRRPDEFSVIIAWLDESTIYRRGLPRFWSGDIAAWEEAISVRDPTMFVAAVFDAPTDRPQPGDVIIPPNATFPRLVTLVDIARTPSTATIVDEVLRLIPPGIVPKVIHFAMDGSASFGRGTIGQNFNDALQLLWNRYADVRPRPFVEFLDIPDERWVGWLTAGVRSFVP